MPNKRILLVFGTRPEAIKLAPVALALKERTDIDARVCVTAQHREMLDQVLDAFGIVPDYDLNLMRPGQTLAGLTSRCITALDECIGEAEPDLVLVQGDTTTAFCGALTAFYRHVAIGHVEAGLRTGDLQAPWPEEANRILVSRIADLHFPPTDGSRKNLLDEGVNPDRVFVTGNTVIDALFIALEKVKASPPPIPGLEGESLDSLGDARVVLITGHRRENFGAGFESICNAIAKLASDFSDTTFIYPVHLNPNVREPVGQILKQDGGSAPNVLLIEPLSYLPFISLMNRADIILTDSGGIQEEAPSLGKPVLVMRETTERPEAVDAGTVKLVGTHYARIVDEVSKLLTDKAAYDEMSRSHNPYGDGKATGRIIEACVKALASG